jgi:hypothetical protein
MQQNDGRPGAARIGEPQLDAGKLGVPSAHT